MLVCAVLLSSLAVAFAAGPPAPAAGKVLVLVIDRIGPADLTPATAPFLSKLADDWSTALMITHTAERENGKEPDLGADYVTLGAGVRSHGSRDSSLSFDPAEPFGSGKDLTTAGNYYKQSNGRAAPAGGVVCLGLSDIKRNNTGDQESVALLGTLLANSKRTTAVAGNEDGYRRPVRLAPLIDCDGTGAVPRGQVADLVVRAPEEPGGFRTDMPRLLSTTRDLLARSDLLVVDTGDTGRVDREAATTSESVLDRARVRAIGRADAFAREAAGLIDLKSSLLLVVSPGAPAAGKVEGDYATPFIAAGKGFSKGLLSSGSTRRPGYVNNTDFAPTVLDFFKIAAPSTIVGFAMETGVAAPSGKSALGYVQSLDRQFTVTRTARWPVVLVLMAALGIFVFLSLACIPAISRRIGTDGWREPVFKVFRPASSVLAAAPASLILVSVFSFDSWVFPLVFCMLYSLLVGLGAYYLARNNSRVDPLTLVCAFSAAALLVDLLFGGRLLIVPLIGSLAQEGLRFFGQSNVVAGFMITYAVWGIVGIGGPAIRERGWARALAAAAFAVLALCLGFGFLGANFGAFLTTAAIALMFFFGTSRGGFRGWRIPAIVAGTAVATIAMVALDSAFVHTHAGRAVARGSDKFLPLVANKLLILFGQIKSVLFLAIVMIVVVVAVALWMKRPGSMWRAQWQDEPVWTAAFFSVLLGSLVALFFNDTGLTMMGAMVIVSIPVVFYHFAAPRAGIETSPATAQAGIAAGAAN